MNLRLSEALTLPLEYAIMRCPTDSRLGIYHMRIGNGEEKGSEESGEEGEAAHE